MKLTTAITALLGSIPFTVFAMPSLSNMSPVDDNAKLIRRTDCTVPINNGFDADGTCVDTTQGNSCPNGILVTGHCPGTANIICCIPERCGINTP
ncbi:hypothetical protein PMZ80_005131 [Knufia obscura]|uniref:Uncharacterized protein n=1 Tax=Knufia obscura TaxID=1635080 RepID=A0ABR0RPN3_9EURO|nr:hypothetical protein PMZ80_005131 [Knufia obscura]